MGDEGYVDFMKETMLPIEEVEFIKTNPEGLTKEGAECHLKNWKHSTNKYQVVKYESMLKVCKNFTESGKTPDGKTIMARDGKNITWSEKI